MAIQTTTWSPDTCECVVEYTWDDTVPSDSRIHTLSNVVKFGPEHQGKTVPELHAILFDENPRKNKLMDKAKTTFPTKLDTFTTQDGVTYTRWKVGLEPTWFYDSSRVLNFTIPGLTVSEKTALQLAADTLLGPGKVKVL